MPNHILGLLLKAAIIIVGVSGIIVTSGGGGFMGAGSTFLYFTVQSNVFAILVATVFLLDEIRQLWGKPSVLSPWMKQTRFVATIAVTITFLVFATMLAPTLGVDYLLSYGNFSLHAIVPMAMVADFFVFGADTPLNRRSSLLGLMAPFAYFVFFLIGSVSGLRYIGGSFAPYFFLDYQANGWFGASEKGLGTFYWFAILFAFFIGLCYLFLLLLKLRRGDFKKKQDEEA